jgi:hypothetical protein
VAAACRLALEAPEDAVEGSPSFIIAAADTVMNRPSAELLAEVFPDVPVNGDLPEFGTLLGIGRARQVLGFEPGHSWRDHVASGKATTGKATTGKATTGRAATGKAAAGKKPASDKKPASRKKPAKS